MRRISGTYGVADWGDRNVNAKAERENRFDKSNVVGDRSRRNASLELVRKPSPFTTLQE